MSTANIHITKLSAAERQLRAAIRMYFSDEDELAVHTVASAAYRLIADIKKDRGMDEAADFHLASTFYVVRDFRREILPKAITANPEFMDFIRSVADNLPIAADSRIEQASVSLSPKDTAKYWNQRNKIANFLKHADRDCDSSICLDDVDNFFLLMLCYTAYTGLTHDHPGNEGYVFHLFWTADLADKDLISHQNVDENRLTDMFRQLPISRRRQLCMTLITKLNEQPA